MPRPTLYQCSWGKVLIEPCDANGTPIQGKLLKLRNVARKKVQAEVDAAGEKGWHVLIFGPRNAADPHQLEMSTKVVDGISTRFYERKNKDELHLESPKLNHRGTYPRTYAAAVRALMQHVIDNPSDYDIEVSNNKGKSKRLSIRNAAKVLATRFNHDPNDADDLSLEDAKRQNTEAEEQAIKHYENFYRKTR